ncbi:MAG TPA: response regulator, partial [Bacteroidetes bacterium]|nr:response regulator [Bacteroidota bacterium]
MKNNGSHYGLVAPAAAPPSSSMVSKNKVLLIEDNPGDARLVEIFLLESDLNNLEVINKTTLQEGLEVLEKEDGFSAILLDLTLPDSRGFETLERLVAKFPQNNIIVLTGLADKELGLKAVKAGAQDFLVKGAFDSDGLAKTLRFSIERNKVLKKLEETQRIAHIGNWEYFPDTGTIEASDEVYRIFGCEGIENCDARVLQIFQEVHDFVAANGKFKKDMEIKRMDGSICYVFIECRSHQIEGDQLVFHGVIQDITERKQAQQEMNKSQARYEEIFTQSKDALFICTLDGKFIDFNQSTISLFGYGRAELLALEDAHDLYRPVERKNEFLLKLKNQKSIKDYEIKIINKEGRKRDCRVSANIIVTNDFIGYNCILRDVTEVVQAEKLRKARDLARRSAQMKEQFVASISHEMRTPMNAILGMSNLLLQMDMEGEKLDLVKSIKQSSEILLGVVNDILEVSEIQNGKIVLENLAFDFHEVLENLINVMQYKAQEKDLYLEVVLGEDVPKYIKGDKLRLNQVLYNLVGNAIKFTDEGHVKIYVKKLHDIGDSVQLKFIVEDTGIGIPEDKIDAIFETFTRIRQKDRLYEGTGLGLSICKNLVELQGGKIHATSTLGKGSVFFFDLIFETAQKPEEVKNIKIGDQPELADDAAFSLLLVEDHRMNQIVAKKTLERKWENIQLTIADNGKIAIDLLREQNFDIVLMDIQMPVMDGYEATKYIREHFPPEKANLPILAMTAHAHMSKDEKFREYGMDDCVLKP